MPFLHCLPATPPVKAATIPVWPSRLRGEHTVGEGVCPSLGEAQRFFRPGEIQWLGKAGNDIRRNEMTFPMKEPGNVMASVHSIEGHGLVSVTRTRTPTRDMTANCGLACLLLNVWPRIPHMRNRSFKERWTSGQSTAARSASDFTGLDLASAQSATRSMFLRSRRC